MNEAHASLVRRVQQQVKGFYDAKQQVKIFHGSSNSTRPFHAGGLAYVDVQDLNHIIEVNTVEGYALVEPNVPLDALVDTTLKLGLIPPMVAEFPGITVGGAVQGGSGESSSFKWGTFHETCLEYEVVLGNGECVVASRNERSDLFHGLSCAYGSLGILTLLKITLIPAKPYVRLSYHRTRGFEDAVEQVRQYCTDEIDFVDGILFGKDSGVVMVGAYTDAVPLPRAGFRHFWNEWFYLHAQKVSRMHEDYEEIIPIKDYLFRYDRGAFWVAKYGFDSYKKVPFNRFTRLLLSGMFSTRKLLKLVHGSGYSYVYIAQDICLPAGRTTQFLDYADAELGIYPLWLCPLKVAQDDILSPSALQSELVINVGVWGDAKPSNQSFKSRNRAVEQQVQTLGGRKVLYAHTYYTRQEFWKIYDQTSYEKLRATYHAAVTFPDVFEKTKTPPSTVIPSKRKGLKALFINPYRR